MVGFSLAVKVEVIATKGSTPRETGAVLWVFADRIDGSIGGGNMENDAIATARLMNLDDANHIKKYTLGPETGQCCGGIVDVRFSVETYIPPARPLLAIFGAGHVGAALARLARAIDIEVQLYDARPFVELPKPEPYIAIAIPEQAIDRLPDLTAIVIMTHDHGLDFVLAEYALRAERFAFVGMIGSRSKAARFKNMHGEIAGNLVSPIAKTHSDKRPESIALAILSEIWPKIIRS